MKLQQVTYHKLVSFENHCNEQFDAVVQVEDGDDWDECHDTARWLVEAALHRSELQREWKERVAVTEYRIASAKLGIKNLREYIAGPVEDFLERVNDRMDEWEKKHASEPVDGDELPF